MHRRSRSKKENVPQSGTPMASLAKNSFRKLVGPTRIELARVAPLDPKSNASAYSAKGPASVIIVFAVAINNSCLS